MAVKPEADGRMTRGRCGSVNSVVIGRRLVRVAFQITEVTQRKVFTTPVRNEVDDVSVTNIIPKVRSLNRKRGCAAVSIGVICYRSNWRSSPDNSPSESGPCVKTMLCDRNEQLVRIVPWRALFEEHGDGQKDGTNGSPQKQSWPQITGK